MAVNYNYFKKSITLQLQLSWRRCNALLTAGTFIYKSTKLLMRQIQRLTVSGPFSPVEVAMYYYVKPYYEAVSLLMIKSEFVFADVNYTIPITIITITHMKITITITCNCTFKTYNHNY